jgi:sulfatase maturation enzyme AslB (radical SAM superfamily)
MSLSELQVVIQKVYEYSDTNNIEKVVFYWQGGEVLTLGPAWFERMHEIVSQVFKGSTIRVRHRLQSNLIPKQASIEL